MCNWLIIRDEASLSWMQYLHVTPRAHVLSSNALGRCCCLLQPAPSAADNNPQALSNTVWAFSKLECLDEALFADVLVNILQRLPQFNSQNVANTVLPFFFSPHAGFFSLHAAHLASRMMS